MLCYAYFIVTRCAGKSHSCEHTIGKGKMSNGFNRQILEEKLSKLNNSQQSIESILLCRLHDCILLLMDCYIIRNPFTKIFKGYAFSIDQQLSYIGKTCILWNKLWEYQHDSFVAYFRNWLHKKPWRSDSLTVKVWQHDWLVFWELRVGKILKHPHRQLSKICLF